MTNDHRDGNEPTNPRGSRLVLCVALTLATAVIAGCGSRLHTQEIVNALAPSATQGAQAAEAPRSQGTATGQSAANPGTPGTAATATSTKTAAALGVPAGQGTSTGKPSDVKGAGSVAAPAAGTNAVTSAGSPPTGPANRSALAVGNLSSYSGLFGAVTNGQKYALSAWVSMQNARGGLDGHPIKLIIGDDQADPVTGLTIEKRMVENDHILALVGNFTVFGDDQYADYATSKGIPFIGGVAVGPRWYTDPNMFPVTAPVTGSIQAGCGTSSTRASAASG
jgi:branched-chain amino acid transport system substrate-binding protein